MPVDHDMLVPLSQKGQPSGSYAMMDGMRPDTAYGMTAPLISRRLMYCSHGRYFSLYQQRKPSYTSSGVRRTLGSCVGRAKTRFTAREIAWLYRSSIKQREENVYCSSTARAKGIFITIDRYWIDFMQNALHTRLTTRGSMVEAASPLAGLPIYCKGKCIASTV